MRIGIDIMGGDTPPQLLFEAVAQAASSGTSRAAFILFATQEIIEEIQRNYWTSISKKSTERIEFCAIQDFIAVDEDPLSALRRKKNASVVVAMEQLKRHEIDALVSVGNTGALIASAAISLPMLPGISRPALLATLPGKFGKVAVVDVGGNLYSKSKHLVQFAQMGIEYQYCRSNIQNPKIGLLNIGAESKKGTKEIRETYALLKELCGSTLGDGKSRRFEFIGNIEGREVLNGNVDVVVTDGFSGNVFLKATEGAVEYIFSRLQEQLHALDLPAVSLKRFEEVADQFKYTEYPGAIVCGVEGLVVKCHGNATARTLLHSIDEAIALVKGKLIRSIKARLDSN